MGTDRGRPADLDPAAGNTGASFPGLTLNQRHSSSLAFAKARAHPVMNGLDGKKLENWHRDGLLSRFDYNLPLAGYKPLMVSGGSDGLRYSPLLQRKKTLWSQLLITAKAPKEPAAAILLERMLDWLQEGEPVTQKIGSLSLSAEVVKALEGWNVQVNSDQNKSKTGPGIVCSPEEAAERWQSAAEIEETVREGGFVWIQGLTKQRLRRHQDLLPGLEIKVLAEADLPLRWAKHPLARAGLDQDWYWVKPHPVYSQRPAEPTSPSEWILQARGRTLQSWKKVVDPGLILARACGQGWILADSIDWSQVICPVQMRPAAEKEGSPEIISDLGYNKERGLRALLTILTNLGVSCAPGPGRILQAENMTVRTPGQPLIRNRNHHYWGIFSNNVLKEHVQLNDQGTGRALVDIKARCRNPHKKAYLQLDINGRSVGWSQVSKPRWQLYRFSVPWGAGPQEITVKLVKDRGKSYNHRYLHVDYLRIEPIQ